MIATVTMNPALDKAMSVPGFCAGKTNRGRIERIEPGGKGINVAQAVKQLGYPVVACGFLAGSNGRHIADDLARRGIPADFVQVAGETRVNLKILDPVSGVETEINEPGFPVDEAALRQLERKIELLARRCTVMVFSGSLPPGAPDDCYAAFIRIAKTGGAKTILDTNGEALRKGLAALPDLIKPNQAELEELSGGPVGSEAELIGRARQLLGWGCGTVVVSLGNRGALLASAGTVLRAHAPYRTSGSTTGAGDAMVGAFACAMLANMDLKEALRLATAAASASAAARTGHVADAGQIREALPLVRIEEPSEPPAATTNSPVYDELVDHPSGSARQP